MLALFDKPFTLDKTFIFKGIEAKQDKEDGDQKPTVRPALIGRTRASWWG